MKAESNLYFTSALPMAYGTEPYLWWHRAIHLWCNRANGFLVFDASVIAIV